MIEQTLLKEAISETEFDKIESALSKFFSKYSMEVIFRKHFRERINDARNKNPITREAFIDVFNRLMQTKNFMKLKHMSFGQEGLMIFKDINFVYTLDKTAKGMQLRFITAMSKDNFKSNNKNDFTLRLESLNDYYGKILEKL